MAAFITRPMSFGDVAPVSAMASATARSTDGRIGRRRQIRLEHRDFGGFLVHQILAAALRELFDRVLALLDERGDDLQRFGVVEGAAASRPRDSSSAALSMRSALRRTASCWRIASAMAAFRSSMRGTCYCSAPPRPPDAAADAGPVSCGTAATRAAPCSASGRLAGYGGGAGCASCPAPTRRRRRSRRRAAKRRWRRGRLPALERRTLPDSPTCGCGNVLKTGGARRLRHLHAGGRRVVVDRPAAAPPA